MGSGDGKREFWDGEVSASVSLKTVVP